MHQHIDFAGLARRVLSMGISQREMARVLGVDQSTVSRLVAGSQIELRGSAAIALVRLAGGQVTIPATQEAPVDGPPALVATEGAPAVPATQAGPVMAPSEQEAA